MRTTSPACWCLLVHQIPAEPLYFRQAVRAQLARIGAWPIKRAVYAAPRTDTAWEALEALAAEITGRGGFACLFEARFADPRIERELERVRSAHRTGRSPDPPAAATVARLRARASSRPPARAAAAGRVWVTRPGVSVDRIACAWYVRRFLEPGARFRFLAAGESRVGAGERGFDFPGAEFEHRDGGCSFEALVAAGGRPRDPALARIAGIVHELDLRDGKFRAPETDGVGRLLQGIVSAFPDDARRIERGAELFDDLYRGFAPAPPTPPVARPRRRAP